MRGGTMRKLVIYSDVAAPPNGVRTQHHIRMTEVLQGMMGNSRTAVPTDVGTFIVMLCVFVCVCISTTGSILTLCWRSQ